MTRLKLYLTALLILLAVLLIAQNTGPAEIRLLLWTVAPPLAIMLLATLLLGVALGVLAALLAGRRPPRKAP